MKIITWNVNGIRAIAKKGFKEFIERENADIYCLQEVKAFENQFIEEIGYIKGYDFLWHAGQRPGYAGTAILFKNDLEIIEKKSYFENEVFNEDGRMVQLEFSGKLREENKQTASSHPTLSQPREGIDQSPSVEGESGRSQQGEFWSGNIVKDTETSSVGQSIVLLNIYFPNGGTRADGTEMLSYKLKFYDEIIKYCNNLVASGKNVVITGDFNICHEEIDIARPKENENSIGFLPIERQKFSEFLDNGYIDIFRQKYPEKVVYSWWSYRAGARPRNIGWRLDYFVVNKNFLENIENIEYLTNIEGSDHCPVSLTIKK